MQPVDTGKAKMEVLLILVLLDRAIKYLRYGGEGRAAVRRGCGVECLSCSLAAYPRHP